MSFGIIKDILRTTFGEVDDYKDDQVKVNCPRCAKLYNNYEPDNKFNLEVNLSKKVYKCWKCEISGRIPKLLKYYSTKELYQLYVDNYDMLDTFQLDNNFDDEFEPVKLPKEFISFKDMNKDDQNHLNAYNYVRYDRKISDDLIIELSLGFCLEGYYKNKIIIPSYDLHNEVNYFIARTFIGDKTTYIKPPSNQDIIFNENRLDYNSTIYIVEGGFDYMNIYFNTLCLLGKDFIPFIFNKLKKYKPPLVFILDPDAIKKTIKYINIFENNSLNFCKFVTLPEDHDIDDLRKKIGNENLSKYILENSRKLTDEDIINFQTYEKFN